MESNREEAKKLIQSHKLAVLKKEHLKLLEAVYQKRKTEKKPFKKILEIALEINQKRTELNKTLKKFPREAAVLQGYYNILS